MKPVARRFIVDKLNDNDSHDQCYLDGAVPAGSVPAQSRSSRAQIASFSRFTGNFGAGV